MSIAYPARPPLVVVVFTLAGGACSGIATRTSPDAQADADSPTDASIASPPDSVALDAGGEFQGEASQSSRFTVSPASIDLGNLAPGVWSPKQTITVTAESDLSDLTVILSGGLTLAAGSCAKGLAAGASCMVVITFRSVTIGAKSESVTIVGSGQSTVVPVTAKVRASPAIVITPNTAQSFIAGCPGDSSSPITFHVANAGDTAVGPVTFEISGTNADEFAATGIGCDLIAPGAACAISVVFTPKAITATAATASLVVTGPGPDFSTVTVQLSGQGLVGANPLLLTPVTSDLGSVAVGTTGPSVTFTLRYSGECPGDVMGPFTVTLSSTELVVTDETCSTSVLSQGGACIIGIALRPTTAGAKSATLSVTPPWGAPAVKMLTGTGVGIDAAMVDAPDAGLDAGAVDTSSEAR